VEQIPSALPIEPGFLFPLDTDSRMILTATHTFVACSHFRGIGGRWSTGFPDASRTPLPLIYLAILSSLATELLCGSVLPVSQFEMLLTATPSAAANAF
jgi:hypothetical protein